MPSLTFHPLTPSRWTAFERLFGERGACGGCWCMLWRLKRSEFDRQKGDGNKRAMQALVKAGKTPGILAFFGDEAVGWCAVAQREDYAGLERSRILKPVDEKPVWSVSCLFVHKAHRNRGVSVALLNAAAGYVKKQGGAIIEGYPVEPKVAQMPAAFAWTGLRSAFEAAGFRECARRSSTRPIMRRELK